MDEISEEVSIEVTLKESKDKGIKIKSVQAKNKILDIDVKTIKTR
jgi:hypothetical protein